MLTQSDMMIRTGRIENISGFGPELKKKKWWRDSIGSPRVVP
jgi:hypothetical protein